MILPAIFWTLKGKLLLGLASIFGVILAIGEASSDRTLILIAIVGSGTTLFVALLSAAVSIFNARKHVKVEQAVHNLSIEVDGKLKELMASKEKAAHSAGAEQERVEERSRQGEAAIAIQGDTPTPVIIEQPQDKPVIVKPVT